MIVVNWYRNAISAETESLEQVHDYSIAMKINSNLRAYLGAFYPISRETTDLDTDGIIPSGARLVFEVFLN